MNKKNQTPKSKARRFVNDALQNAIPIDTSITIAVPPERIYEFWRDTKNLPKFLSQLTSIDTAGGRVSEWTWEALKGAVQVKWKSEITAEDKPKRLAWQSLEGAMIAHAGEIVLKPVPHKQATELHLHLDYAPPGGKVTDFLSQVLGEAPAAVLQNDLKRLRQLLEVGYLCTIEGQPKGNEPGGATEEKTESKAKKEQK